MENISQNAMKYCMRGKGGSPKDKPQVYFAYHPADYRLYFREITDKILEYADCAVFYHEDPENTDRNELRILSMKSLQKQFRLTGRKRTSPPRVFLFSEPLCLNGFVQ